ncbi:ABC-F family ATP-binding cassette domain-containing protein [Sediminitomix flava]|uniref:ATP-binding cassette subfamily F protein 3 n=1 Tax=Sediminitomix flava TaxID=379075 RepID=A0A315Z741_SEDFL|nr:ABC-F family ATP-binding cassette domain-containing protein [Sediminitomix flava]PWJ38585.1 ATP-binding cassette subfamily F protein 3 [Sediminitomix flava]
MLTLQNISLYFGSRTMYRDANLHIKPKQRIGVIGANGAGKTTLLKVINGDILVDEGQVSKPKDLSIGFLNQDMLSYQTQESILHVAMQAFGPVLEVQDKMDVVIKELETNYSDDLVNKLSKLQEEFERMEGYTVQAKAEEILAGLGFTNDELQQPLVEFSGGWRMRVMLAKLLLQRPDVLMLDEPTNHLDLPSIEWLENYISSFEGAVLIVSHDREFLNRAVNVTVEVSGGQLTTYSGNYSFYLEEKAMRNEVQKNAFANQQQKIKQTEQFINRFRAQATKARQVQSKVKMLDRMERIEDVREDSAAIDFDFRFSTRPGKIIFDMKDVDKAYGPKKIFEDAQIAIERGDKIALIGANGKGKSTLLRMVGGTEGPDKGDCKLGHNVIPSFYAQHQLESLTLENEILQELSQAGSDKTELELRTILGAFLFTGEDVFKKIKVLSGGEKSRVALAKTLISEANFHLLDEPTNHLDIVSVNILIQALQRYEGTFLIVSHDRYFISNVATKIWYIEDHQVKEYPGTYAEYMEWVSKRNIEEKLEQDGTKSEKPKKKEKKQMIPSEKKQWQKDLRKAKKMVEESEAAIMQLEEEIEALEGQLADEAVFTDQTKLAEVNTAYAKAKETLDQKNEEWETWLMTLEELEEQDPDKI